MKTLAQPEDRAENLRRLRTMKPASERRWGRMSAHQTVCHCADALRMATGALAVAPDTSVFKRTLLKWVVLWAPVPWPAGRVATCPELDQERGGTRPTEFAADLAATEAVLAAVIATPRASLANTPHPLFGAMSDADWLRWGWLHLDHHLRQFGA